MPLARRIYISGPADKWLTPPKNELKWGIVEEIERAGYIPEIFFNPKGGPGLAAGKAWSPGEADKVARRCVGAAMIGLPRWSFQTPHGAINMPTEFCHYEGAIARTLALPTLVLVQEDVIRRGIFTGSFGGYVGEIPPTADRTWLATDDFRVPFKYWLKDLSDRRDVFLGYCGSSTGTAQNLKRFLTKDLNVSVLDWKTDFRPGRTILEEIEEAANRCAVGIFLFTQDDKIENGALANRALPRDNVVFEAGYFSGAKGKDSVLIILENGAKMPADLGGDIYASLDDKSNIEPIQDTVRRYLEAL